MYYESLVIGKGEVGASITRVLRKRQKVQKCGAIDRKDRNYEKMLKNTTCKTLHICYPYGKSFIKATTDYCRVFQPELVIIHSTVPVGTTTALNYACVVKKIRPLSPVVHSPVRGQHPELDKALLTFVKYIGTVSEEAYNSARKEMSNMKTKWFEDPKDTELGKILSTSYYGLCIAWHREMKKFCDSYDVDFENAVTDFNKTYNGGYRNLRPNVIRPVLTPPTEKIGGHCVTQNAKMLKKERKSKFLDLIK